MADATSTDCPRSSVALPGLTLAESSIWASVWVVMMLMPPVTLMAKAPAAPPLTVIVWTRSVPTAVTATPLIPLVPAAVVRCPDSDGSLSTDAGTSAGRFDESPGPGEVTCGDAEPSFTASGDGKSVPPGVSAAVPITNPPFGTVAAARCPLPITVALDPINASVVLSISATPAAAPMPAAPPAATLPTIRSTEVSSCAETTTLPSAVTCALLPIEAFVRLSIA